MFVTILGQAARNLRRHARFTATAAVVLGFGIGVTTLVFTILNSVLLWQLPFRNPENLVWIWVTLTDRDRAFFSIPNFLDVQEQSTSFEDIAAFTNFGANLTGAGEAERLVGVMVTTNAFELLGVEATVGRTLARSDGRPGMERAVVLKYGVWQDRFGGDRSVVGRMLRLNGDSYKIVGILPQHFIFPGVAEAEFVVPLVLETDPRRTERGTRFLRGFGRLHSGKTVAQARLELAAIFERLKTEHPLENGKHTAPRLLPLRDELVGNFRTLIWTIQAAVAGVLLIACSNLANMFLARSSTRRREFAIRSAIGGSRYRIFAQLFTESLLMAFCAGTLGLLMAAAGLNAFVAAGPTDLPRAAEIALDWRVVGFAFGVSLLTAILFGLAPARYASRFDLIDELKYGRSNAGRPSETRMRRALVAGEVALAVVLLIVAGLFMRSFKNLQSVDTGLQSRNILLMRLSLTAPSGFGELSRKLLPAVRELPGVRSAALASIVPLSGLNTRTDFTIAGRPALSRTDVPGAQHRWVSGDYFQTMGIPIVQGRSFSEFDKEGSAGVAIVDQTLAGMFFPNEDPVGKHIRITDRPAARMAEIVGVVGNVKHFTVDEAPAPTLYSATDQIHTGALAFVAPGFRLIVRTSSEPAGYAQVVRERVRSVDKDVPVSAIATMDQYLSATVSARRFNVLVLDFFGVAALVLSAMGLYAVVSYMVARRKSEIGIRMALGANRGAVLSHVVVDGMKLATAGVAIGVAVAFIFTRAIAASLFGVSPLDPATFMAAPVLMGLTSLAAVSLAALAATRVDPAALMRSDSEIPD